MNTRAITTIIVDDEINAIQNLSEDLNAYPDINILETTTSALKAQKSIIKLQPDLLFLDVEMPQMNGIELLQKIRPYMHSNMHVVFYSAFDKYMIDALRASAFDYLLKPYHPDELKLIIDRVHKKQSSDSNNFEQSIRRLLNDGSKFALQTMTSLLLLRCSDILYFRYLDEIRCWQVTLTSLEHHRLRMTIKAKDILNLNQSFVRINSNCILNIEYLSSIENNTLRCILYPPFTNMEMTASRRHYSKLKEILEVL